jgi:hypothetical protein
MKIRFKYGCVLWFLHFGEIINRSIRPIIDFKFSIHNEPTVIMMIRLPDPCEN